MQAYFATVKKNAPVYILKREIWEVNQDLFLGFPDFFVKSVLLTESRIFKCLQMDGGNRKETIHIIRVLFENIDQFNGM